MTKLTNREAFYGGLAWRMANLVTAPVGVTHPLAMSYALGLRIDPELRSAQASSLDNAFDTALEAVGPLALFSGWIFGSATTTPIQGRLLNDPSSEVPADVEWKAGASAADAYGKLLNEEFGNGTKAAQETFASYGMLSLSGEGIANWMAVASSLIPSLQGDTDAQTRWKLARFILGVKKSTADALLPHAERTGIDLDLDRPGGSTMATLVPSQTNLFSLAANLRRQQILRSGVPHLRQGTAPTTEPTTTPAPSSSAQPVGAVVGGLVGGAAGYFLAGKSPLVAGVGFIAGAAAGYFGAGALAKP